MEEKFLTRHPQGKKGVSISRKKYELIKDYILTTLQQEVQISYQELNDRCVKDLSPTFEGQVAWYVVTVKLDLEARGIISRIPKTSPHEIKLN